VKGVATAGSGGTGPAAGFCCFRYPFVADCGVAPGSRSTGSRAAGVAMAFKLIESAQAHWRAVNAPHLVALVRAGARFESGQLVERPDESGGDQQAA
jgi:hypothetical protein